MGFYYHNTVGQRLFASDPPHEPPNDVVIGYCGFCHDEIYEGETIYCIDGKRIHEDCLEEFAKDYFSNYKEEA